MFRIVQDLFREIFQFCWNVQDVQEKSILNRLCSLEYFVRNIARILNNLNISVLLRNLPEHCLNIPVAW
jgi:hypothetical protein